MCLSITVPTIPPRASSLLWYSIFHTETPVLFLNGTRCHFTLLFFVLDTLQQGLLKLSTRVVRGLMAKLVPKLDSEDAVQGGAEGSEGGKDEMQQGVGVREGGGAEDDDSLEIQEGEVEGVAGGGAVESKTNEERKKAVAVENKVGGTNSCSIYPFEL